MQPESKPVVMLAPLTTPTNAATATARLDTLGYSYVTIDVICSTANATTKPTTLKLSEYDGTTAASASDIDEAVGGGASGFTIPAMDTDVSGVVRFNVDLKGRKRYLFLTFAPASVHNTCVLATLSKGEKPTLTATLSTTAGQANLLARVDI